MGGGDGLWEAFAFQQIAFRNNVNVSKLHIKLHW